MLAALMRWLVAGSLGIAVTVALFAAMIRLSDGSWILEHLVRIFPLTQTELPPEDDCPEGVPLGAAIDVEGVIGSYRDGVFHPASDARVVGHNAHGNDVEVEVSETGIFRFVTGFASGEPTSCPLPPAEDQYLRISAAGCTGRDVPITSAWLPHRVLLECEPARP